MESGEGENLEKWSICFGAPPARLATSIRVRTRGILIVGPSVEVVHGLLRVCSLQP